jgi:hypothetical protein
MADGRVGRRAGKMTAQVILWPRSPGEAGYRRTMSADVTARRFEI